MAIKQTRLIGKISKARTQSTARSRATARSRGAEPRVTELENGLRVVSIDMPHLETTSLGIYVDVGARHEAATENGISHLIEHMAFKGTKKRSAKAIAEEIEEVGGEINAATSVETTAYYARVLAGDVRLGVDILSDILINPRYELGELQKERDVILQEIAATKDSPEEIAFDLMNTLCYPDQALGRPILGSAETVSAQSPKDLRSFLANRYGAQGMVLSAAGRVDHAALVGLGQEFLGRVGVAKAPRLPEPARFVGGAIGGTRTFEQCQFLAAFEGPTYKTGDNYTAQVFSGLFGGGMSSRLFQEAREKRGLCYSIYSSAWSLADTGMVMIHAATGAHQLDELVGVIRRELESIARKAPSEREVERSKAQLRAGLLMALESSGTWAEQMARHMRVWGRFIPAADLVARLDAVTPDAVRDFAAGLLDKAPAVVVVGAGKKSGEAARRARAMIMA